MRKGTCEGRVRLTWRAVVDVRLTVVSAVSRLTPARVAALIVHAAAAISARVLLAFIHIFTAAWTYTIVKEITTY